MTEQPWYVHILGPDDIEGPFDTMEHALRHAAQINSWLTEREDPITEFTPMLWAVPTLSEWGTTNYEPTDPSVQPPTREQIAEALVEVDYPNPDFKGDPADYYHLADAVLALFPQPTPSAEPDHHLYRAVRLADGRVAGPWAPGERPQISDAAEWREEVSGPGGWKAIGSTEPVSIADMAPGTCDECGGTGVCGGPPDRYYDCPRCSGEPVDLDDTRDDRDPSTIRDVTPPPATPEEGVR